MLVASCSREREFSPPAWIHGSWSDGKRDQIRFTGVSITEAADSTEDYYSKFSTDLNEAVYGDSLYYVFTPDDSYLDKFVRIDPSKMKRLTVRHRREITARAVEKVFHKLK